MIKKLSLGFILVALFTLTVPAIVLAETENDQNQATTTSVKDPSADTLTEEQKAQKLQERIKQAKEMAKSKVSASQEKRLAGLCKAAQSVIGKIQSNTSTFSENRQTKYVSVSEKLNSLSAKLSAAGADTTELNSAIAELEAKSLANQTALNEYATKLADLTTIDCASDPAGFKAILDATRSQRQEIFSQTSSVRAYINETIKPILQGIRSSLQSANEGEGTN